MDDAAAPIESKAPPLSEDELAVLTDKPSGPVDVTLPDGELVPGRAVMSRKVLGWFSSVLMTEERARELSLPVESIASMFAADRELSSGERDDLEDLLFDLNEATSAGFTEVQWSSPPSGPSPFQLELILTGLALVFSLFVVGVSLALAAAESKDERDVLTTAGAPPGVLARSAGARAWLLSGIGGAMAIPVGFLPVVVFAKAAPAETFTDRFPLVFPTRTAVLLLLLVPLVVAVASWLSSASAQRLRPVRVSTTTFE